MRARMAAYSAWNSAPSRLSHSSSDGVNGRGAEEIAGFGLGEDVDAEADVDVVASGLDLPVKRRLESEAVEAPRRVCPTVFVCTIARVTSSPKRSAISWPWRRG